MGSSKSIFEKKMLWGWSNTGTGLDLHCWRHSKLIWRRIWATSSNRYDSEQDIELWYFQRLLQMYMNLWFCDFFTVSFDTLGLAMACYVDSELIQGSPIASTMQKISQIIFSGSFSLIFYHSRWSLDMIWYGNFWINLHVTIAVLSCLNLDCP